ncbi:MAG TPA: asparagine synthase (glutamine-hydrolyzing) [Candidatus Scatomonas pullistercoris]|uniref:asparagine synthase (glutamine-hydrolyzing) n=1 Tax=Candidatus Scatomonas pullistercoris TaxID=2840920 RepID=A0A9D1P2B7_9FIRM|nr:asparagine synthase (glutamine-hydrolyzing) [Candidatus Scatomonas pullistercoris]
MCGICGFTGETDGGEERQIRRMAELITHRGPDSCGFFGDAGIHMGFRRLAIIDLAAGNQPVYNEEKTLVLTFNGEIYNYRELREELLARGHFFSTNSDSEVLVHGYEEWGENLLLRLRGMFAFAIWDTRDGSLFLARDFFGIKPLYYMRCGDCLVYGSEIKCLLAFPGFRKELNQNALDSYLSFQYVVPPETLYRGIFCLPPAHWMRCRNGKIILRRYWEPRFCPDEKMTLEEAADRIEAAFQNSVEAHKISDVEVGCFLSSGVDSSWAASYFSGQKAFTVGFDAGSHYNEIWWAKKVAQEKQLCHTCRLIGSDEFFSVLPQILNYLDQPLADPACVALYFVSELASRQVKVVLSGEGADELFGGYRIYHMPASNSMYQKMVPAWLRRAVGEAARYFPDIRGRDFLVRASRPLEETFIGNASMFSLAEKRCLLRRPEETRDPSVLCRPYYRRAGELDAVTKMQYLDLHLWLVGDILLKADRMSMANSLELRVPFLDREVFQAASVIPEKWKVTENTTKYAMRVAAERHLPKNTAEKPKLGFPVPIRLWLKEEKYYGMVREEFSSEAAGRFFRQGELLRLLERHVRGREDLSRKIWTVYMFLLWYRVCFLKKY